MTAIRLLCTLALPAFSAGCRSAPTTPVEAAAVPPSAGETPHRDATQPAAAAKMDTAYLFGWGDVPAPIATPRGGTSHGGSVTLAPPRPLPLDAIAAAGSSFERDRTAILALAGDYRVDFHFLETIVLTPGQTPSRPYHSWATERIRVIEDAGRFISLQHTLVMFFAPPGGAAPEPMVQKHWRQDWTYEDTDLHTFRGEGTWARRRPSAAEAAEAWSQAVFQVDDSPRYEALGRWEHTGNRSIWTSETAWRPLPRREHTVRNDYDVLEGRHRIVLTPTGWVHEQDNWKRVAGEGTPGAPRFLAQESGLDRYDRIAAPSLAAADTEWSRTAPYWAAVRRVWREIHAAHDRFTLRSEVEGEPLFAAHFACAAKLAGGEPLDPARAEQHARETILRYLQLSP